LLAGEQMLSECFWVIKESAFALIPGGKGNETGWKSLQNNGTGLREYSDSKSLSKLGHVPDGPV
jgi:hypothetical protein